MSNPIPSSEYPGFTREQLALFFSASLGQEMSKERFPFLGLLLDDLFPSKPDAKPKPVSMKQVEAKITKVVANLRAIEAAARSSVQATERRWNASQEGSQTYVWAEPGETVNIRFHAEAAEPCNCE